MDHFLEKDDGRMRCRGMLHIVKDGDTLYKIAKQYGVPLSRVMYANPYVDVYNLQIGDEICVPVMAPRPPMGGNRPGSGRPPMGGNRPGSGRPPMGGGNCPGNGRPPMGGNCPGSGRPPMGGNCPGSGRPPMGGNCPGNGRPPMGGNCPRDRETWENENPLGNMNPSMRPSGETQAGEARYEGEMRSPDQVDRSQQFRALPQAGSFDGRRMPTEESSQNRADEMHTWMEPNQANVLNAPTPDRTDDIRIPVGGGTGEMPMENRSGMLQMPMADRTADMPMTDRTADMPMADRTADMPMADRTADMPMADRTTDMPMADRTADMPMPVRERSEVVRMPVEENAAMRGLPAHEPRKTNREDGQWPSDRERINRARAPFGESNMDGIRMPADGNHTNDCISSGGNQADCMPPMGFCVGNTCAKSGGARMKNGDALPWKNIGVSDHMLSEYVSSTGCKNNMN